MNNVIDLTKRLKKQATQNSKAGVTRTGAVAPIIDMTEMRAEIISQERRRTKRTVLSEFIGAFVLVPRKGLLRVTLYDISDNGLAFDVSDLSGHFSVGDEIAIRFYLNQETYFAFTIKIQNVRAVEDEKSFRHGAGFLKASQENEALQNFVRFIETVSAQLQTDKGDLQISSVVR